MAINTKWDITQLTDLSRTLEKEKDSIVANRNFLANINTEVEKAWQGYAGRTFDQRMDVDVQNLDNLIKGLEELTSDLKRATSDCYEPCEETVKAEIRKLRSTI